MKTANVYGGLKFGALWVEADVGVADVKRASARGRSQKGAASVGH